MKCVRLGIIGCGVIGSKHAAGAAGSKDIDLVAVADLAKDKARKVADQWAVPHVYEQGRNLLKDDQLQAVVLAIPADGRARLVKQALKLGRHVLVEKPAAFNLRELRSILAAQGDRVAACASSRFRAFASARAAERFIASGKLGKTRLIRIRDLRAASGKPKQLPPDWRLSRARNAGGILVNWGVYDLDYILGLFAWRLEPLSVTAQCWTMPPAYRNHVVPDSDGETHYTAFIRCAEGAVIVIERGEYVSTAEPEAAWEVVGDNGTLRLDMLPGEEKRIVFDRADAARGVVSKTIWQGDESFGTVHEGPVRDFGHAIRYGHPPLTSLQQEADVVRITDAIYASAARGSTVNL